MPNVVKVLKEEITRISRREAKAAVSPVRKPTLKVRKDLAALKARVSSMEKTIRQLQGSLTKAEKALPAPPPEAAVHTRFFGKGIKSMRKKLGLSQADFATLAGVSGVSVYNWERNPGMLKLRTETRKSLESLRGMGTREARQRLEEIGQETQAGKKSAKTTRKRKRPEA